MLRTKSRRRTRTVWRRTEFALEPLADRYGYRLHPLLWCNEWIVVRHPFRMRALGDQPRRRELRFGTAIDAMGYVVRAWKRERGKPCTAETS